MTWFDAVALVIILVIAWLESVRGFGRALFDLVGALIITKLALVLCHPLAAAAPISTAPGPSEAFWLAIAFVILASLILIATKFIYESTLLTLDVLDPVVGAFFGLVSGILAAHVFLRVLQFAYTDTEVADLLLNSFMGQEILQFRTYHAVVTALQNISKW